MKNMILGMVTLLLAAYHADAQVDPHFSQYYANPLWLNPALAGTDNGDLRVNGNFKSQWANINNSYRTGALSADYRPGGGPIGLGLSVLDQSAAGSTFNYFSAYGMASYEISVSQGGDHKITFGMQGGVINRSFDPNGLQFGSQFDPNLGFNPSMSSMENFSSTSKLVFDAGAGVYYYDNSAGKKINAFGGISAGHLNRPEDPFTNSGNNRIPVRWTVHGGARIKTNRDIDVLPHLLYVRQQEASIKGVGTSGDFRFRDGNSFIAGVMYRFSDAAIVNVGYHFERMMIGASYDFNTSSLNRATYGNGGIELSMSYVFRKRAETANPVSPRL